MRRGMQQVLIGIMLGSALSGCGIFGDDKDEALQPTELTNFKATLALKKLWSVKLGDDAKNLRLGLSPTGDGNRVYAASRDGKVSALQPDTGKRLWTVEVNAQLSAGPGVGENLVVVLSSDGEVIALNASDGRELWRSDISGESLAAPAIANGAVSIRTIDGKLRVLSTDSGEEQWVVEQSVPRLTLRGVGAPVIVGDAVVSGFDNGRVLAATLSDGATVWEAMLSPPTGRSDLERLADVDGAIAAVGNDLYVAGFHGRIAAIAAESGQVLWARELSTHNGLGVDWSNVYAVADTGDIVAMSRRSGAETWRNPALLRRGPTAPVAFNTAVAVGDFEGYVHLFNSADGALAARVRLGKDRIAGVPFVQGDTLFVQSEGGSLSAIAVQKPKTKKKKEAAPAADAADAEPAE